MSASVNGFRWSARILAVLYALFLSIFALDVFGEGFGFFDTLLALVMHLIPSILIATIIILAWRRELIGAIVFASLALVYCIWSWPRFDWMAAIAAPLLLASGFYYISWRMSHPATAG